MNQNPNPPIVMTMSGNDPTGGAGIQADIETLLSMGCHAAPVITTLTVQDTQDIKSYATIETDMLIQQARAVLEDMAVSAFKIGLLGAVETVEALHTLLIDYPDIPVVLDPILISGGGSNLADDDIVEAMANLLFPLSTIITPNSTEARLLAPEADTLDACAQVLQELGCEHILITGTHENNREVINRLYGEQKLIETFHWERLPGTFHGSGCTLASAIAGLLANGMDILTAVNEAQEYTLETLRHGYRIGMGQLIPNRLFWANAEPTLAATDDNE
jgi:hydroxymethylpyrimidine/phosphomethylpyrimidine kinase